MNNQKYLKKNTKSCNYKTNATQNGTKTKIRLTFCIKKIKTGFSELT